MKVKFTRSIIADGAHREVNSEADIPDIEARALIAAGECIPADEMPVEPSAPEPPIENAESRAPAKAEKAARK